MPPARYRRPPSAVLRRLFWWLLQPPTRLKDFNPATSVKVLSLKSETLISNFGATSPIEMFPTTSAQCRKKSTKRVIQTNMFRSLVALVFLLGLACSGSAQTDRGFIFNGFQSGKTILNIDGATTYTQNGLLQLTSSAYSRKIGHAFFPVPITFKNSTNGTAFSFSTTFVSAFVPEYPSLGGHGMAFVIVKETGTLGSLPSQYLGIFKASTMGNESNHVFAVELDTTQDFEFGDIDDNHVGIDINGLVSIVSKSAGYYSAEGHFNNLSMKSGKAIQVWVEYDGTEKHINVTLAPIHSIKPLIPLLSLSLDLSPIVKETMFVGFSAATGLLAEEHYVMGWSFKMNGQAQELSISQLPKLTKEKNKRKNLLLKIGVALLSICFSITFLVILLFSLRKRKFAEVLEDWELEYGPHRFKYKDLYTATKGFGEQDLLGKGGFGRVYKGVLPTSKIAIAVKRVSHESRQGIKEFVAEIVTLGRLRHRNLVTLLGYCRRKHELFLVYEYMPNGSLNNYLHNQPKLTLAWKQRFRAIKGVASGLFYLHEEWEKVVIHRDIKASNVLLDAEMNARLGDFGLAKLYNHEAEPQTTHVAGTFGYLAPEYVRSSKATKATDVYAFGAFLLEVACGRKPIEVRKTEDNVVLVDWVFTQWRRRELLEARDPNLGEEFDPEEMELVLMLGLICSHSDKNARLSMRQVLQYLEGDIPLQQLSSSLSLCSDRLTYFSGNAFENCPALPVEDAFEVSSCVSDSLLSGGR